MTIRVALHHKTTYQYDRLVSLGPHVVRLRPAPHCRTPVTSYSLKVTPSTHFINWQQDPHGNYLARLVFPEKTKELSFEVDLIAELSVINPFDFFLESDATEIPFSYADWLKEELRPYLATLPACPRMDEFVAAVPRANKATNSFLVDLNQYVHHAVKYVIRMEAGVQSPEETLTKGTGSCRDSAWLLVQLLRSLGLAARFVSGYLIQLKPDVKSLDGPSGTEVDFTDLHAWCEVYLPGAGWVGMDATSGLFTGEGHLPLAATPDPFSAAPISGAIDECETAFDFQMSIHRVFEDPRVTKPYTDDQWQRIESLGRKVDDVLQRNGVKMTMGGEPTFVSVDDMESPEWNTAAQGPHKRKLAGELFTRMADRFSKGPLLHFGQGKWYPGESLPRWALACYWRKDGQPIWHDESLIAQDSGVYKFTETDAQAFVERLARNLGVPEDYAIPAHEDVWYYMWKERRLPSNVNPLDSNLALAEDRDRLAKVFEQGLGRVVGYTLPLRPRLFGSGSSRWESGPWFLRQEHMYLVPGDSAMGFRLPLDSIPWAVPEEIPTMHERDPLAEREALPVYGRSFSSGLAATTEHPHSLPQRTASFSRNGSNGHGDISATTLVHQFAGVSALAQETLARGVVSEAITAIDQDRSFDISPPESNGHSGNGHASNGNGSTTQPYPTELPWKIEAPTHLPLPQGQSAPHVVRTALCVEARQGTMHVFMPPLPHLEDYLELVSKLEQTAAELKMPIRIEGYAPPYDYRIQHFKVTPDPGVIEVNLQPAESWDELVHNTITLYDEARLARLGTEKFMQDGRHTGTGGGNHLVIGGPTPSQSPILRRPDLLRSLVAYWNNRPSLSYLFSGMFVGPTSQAPRVDEARHESIYELETAFAQIPESGICPPWLVDRIFRHLLTDLTGNTHRAEFCIDKLYSPDSSTGRLGLVEFRGFEMPPHAQMSLTQQLLLRSLIARFWEKPYKEPLVRWGTSLHDKFMLPHFVAEDIAEVVEEQNRAGFALEQDWFATHFEFRFPRVGQVAYRGVSLELRQAIEPWNVLGEEAGPGGTARYVDSSVERLQVKVQGLTDPRHVLVCGGRRVPLHPTGVPGEFVAGVRYRAWQPPSCLHPTIGVHAPLVFDLYDTWNQRSIGGCTWNVSHPGGRSFDDFPVNAYAAESRRAARFSPLGHTGGTLPNLALEINRDYPLTLDLRRPREPAPLPATRV